MARLLFAPGWYGCRSAAPVQVEQPVLLTPRCGFNWPPETMMKCAYSEPPFSASLICQDGYNSYASLFLSKKIILQFTSHLLLQDPLLWACDLYVAVSPMAVARYFEAASWITKAFPMKWFTYFHNMSVQICERNVQLHVFSFFACYVTHGHVSTASENTWVSQPCIISKALIRLPSGPESLLCFIHLQYHNTMGICSILDFDHIMVLTPVYPTFFLNENN